MPSFEETKSTTENPEHEYEPGQTNSDSEPKNEAVVVEETPSPAAKEETEKPKNVVPEELKPANLDANLPMPKPAILQKVAKKGKEPESSKKSNLRSRWGADAGAKSKQEGESIGALEDPSAFKESLSGRKTRAPMPRKKRESENTHAKAKTGGDAPKAESTEKPQNRERKPAAKKRANNRSRNRENNREGSDEKREGRSRNDRPKGNKQNPRGDRKAAPAKKAAQAKKPEPTGLIGKIVNAIRSFFSGPEETPKKEENKRPSRPNNRRPRRKNYQNKNRSEDGGDRPPAKKRANNRRRPQNRNRNRNQNQNRDRKPEKKEES